MCVFSSAPFYMSCLLLTAKQRPTDYRLIERMEGFNEEKLQIKPLLAGLHMLWSVFAALCKQTQS